MRRVEHEASRMGRLVDDMLLLARLDEGRPLDLVDVDLGHIAEDAVGDARAVEPGRPITLSAEDGVVVSGDADRLRQVAANLAGERARAHACRHAGRGAGTPGRPCCGPRGDRSRSRARRPSSRTRCSSGSCEPIPRGRARRVVRASGSPSSPRSSKPMAGAQRSSRSPAKVRRSVSCSPRRRLTCPQQPPITLSGDPKSELRHCSRERAKENAPSCPIGHAVACRPCWVRRRRWLARCCRGR